MIGFDCESERGNSSSSGKSYMPLTRTFSLTLTRTFTVTGACCSSGASSSDPIVLSAMVPGLFKGVTPRVMWISIGGFVFFGAYASVKDILSPDEE